MVEAVEMKAEEDIQNFMYILSTWDRGLRRCGRVWEDSLLMLL
jgi:hypothetical protein